MKKLPAIILAATIGLGGCSAVDRFDRVDMTRDELLGTAAGAALGGYLGYQFGGTMLMSSVFASGGALVGGTAGYLTTRALLGTDRAEYEKTARKGLASAGNGKVVHWENPETGNSGVFRPMNTFKTADGRLCRQYRATVAFEGSVRSGVGMACQNAKGEWQTVSDQLTVKG